MAVEVGSLVVELNANVAKFQRDLGKANRHLDKFAGSVRTSVGVIGGALAGVGVVELGQQLYEAGRSAQSLERAFTAVAGSTDGAKQEMAFLRTLSGELGQNFYTLADSYKSINAASKGTNLEGRKTRDIFVSVVEASTALGLRADQTSGALRALEQMMSKGNVQAEELSGQLGERLPGAFNLAAEAMGVSTMELNDMLKAGEVLAEDLLPKLANLLSQKYGKAAREAAKQTNNAAAAQERLSQAVQDLKTTIADGGFLNILTTGINDLGFALRWATGNKTIADVARQIEYLQAAIKDDPTGANRALLSDRLRELRIEFAKMQAAGIDSGAIKIGADRYSVTSPTTPKATSTKTDSAKTAAESFGDPYNGVDAWLYQHDDAVARAAQTAAETERVYTEAYKGMESVAMDSFQAMGTSADKFAMMAADSLSAMTASGAADFSDMIGSMAADLGRLATHKAFQMLFGQLLGAGLSGGTQMFSSGISATDIAANSYFADLAGGRAMGGPVAAGKTYVVGEKGPELLTLGSSGYVTPNHALGGGMTVNVHNYAGADVSTQGSPDGRSLDVYVGRAAVGGIVGALQRGDKKLIQTMQRALG